MASGSTTPAGWAGFFIDWMHPLALILAIIFPLIRSLVRKMRKQGVCFQSSFVVHDAASGLALPSFIALTLSGLSPVLVTHVDGHSAILAGVMGIVYTCASILKGDH